jgi:hypothetical protein
MRNTEAVAKVKFINIPLSSSLAFRHARALTLPEPLPPGKLPNKSGQGRFQVNARGYVCAATSIVGSVGSPSCLES